jgi:long-chain alkane monooxygenase
MSKEIRLNAFTINSPGHLSTGLWRHPDDQSHRYADLRYWADLAVTLERGLFDGLFIADVLGVYDVYGHSPDAALRNAAQVPINDPLQLVSAMTAVTRHLGFGVTASVSFEHPYPFARRMSTADHLSGGRIGWNVVTSYLESGARNLGQAAQLTHDNRYELAEEYLAVCYKLWEGSWESGAVRRDAANGIYVDPKRVHEIGHRGEFFTVPGFHLSEPSPQRTPALYQAGASSRGKQFAARHGECVFVAAPTRAILRRQVDSLRAEVERQGRQAGDILIFNQITVVLAPSDEQARAKFDDYRRYISRDGSLALMSVWTGIDLSRFDPEQTLEHVESNAIQSAAEAFTSADPERSWTINEIADYCGIGGDGPVIVGSPGTVADALQVWIEETGADGFNIAAVVNPGSFADIADLLVPELQRRRGWIGVLIDAGVSLSFFSAFFSSINAAARIIYTFGRQGVLHELTGRAHEANATPHIAVALVALLSLVTALIFSAHGTALLDSYGYLSMIATYGWLLAYVLVAVGAPLYLRRQGKLKVLHVLLSIVSVVLLAIALIGSVYPVQDGVYAWLPYVFLALLALGLAWFLVLRVRSPERLKELEADLLKE